MTEPSFQANTTNPVKSPQMTKVMRMSWGLMSLLIWHSSIPISLAQTQPSIPTITPASIRVPDAYTLGPGDLLRVDILDVPEYSGEYLILTDGTINLPLIGQISVAGLSVSQVTEKIFAAYAPFVQQPFPSVRIITPRPISIAVGGEVQRPGTYILPLSTSNTVERQFQFYTVTQLLQQAGGITQSADITRVKVQRQDPTRLNIVVNLKELLENGDLSQDLVLRDRDTIVVPTAENLDPVAIRQINSANFAPEEVAPFQVVIVGEVFNPGTYIMGEGIANLPELPTITQAIQRAGGIKPQANLRRIQLQRLTQAGELKTITVDLWKLLTTGDATQDISLQPGDSIIIPTASAVPPDEIISLASASFSPRTMIVNVVGEVTQPGALQVPINTTLNQAILVAGGFNRRRANTGTVELLRLRPDGTVSRRQISIDFQAGLNTPNNPVLQQDDVVVVNRSALTEVADTFEEVLRPVGGLIGVSALLNIINVLTEDRNNN